MYCGAPLPQEVREAAASAAERVLQTRNLAALEQAAMGPDTSQVKRRYVVIDTTTSTPEIIASACSVSVWEARQWQAASRYRLLKISREVEEDRLESNLRGMGLDPIVFSEETVARARSPIPIDSIDTSAQPAVCMVREKPEGALFRREIQEEAIALIVSGPIKREKQRPQASKVRLDSRLDDGWLVHLHFLEAPFQGRILLDVFAILIECGGADAMQLAARQSGLQHIARVHGTLGLAGADHGV